MTIARLMSVTFLALLLSACGAKPPNCADPEILDTIRGILAEGVIKEAGPLGADDPDGYYKKFLGALKAELFNVVNDGYKAEIKKQQCKGTLKLTTPSGENFERAIEYSAQRTEDKGGGTLIEVQAFQPFVVATAGAAYPYYAANRWAGTWGGTYACGGIGGATEGPQGPFSMPVTMVVEGQTATLERTTRGGGYEKLAGDIGPGLRLSGVGMNSPDDQWRARFNGIAKGREVTAQGELNLPNRGVFGLLRKCTLRLTQGQAAKPAAAPAAQAPLTPAGPSATAQPAPATPAPVQQPVAAATAAPKARETDASVESAGVCKGLDLAVTADNLECASRKFKIADDALTAQYKDAMARLSDQQKSALREKQRAWVKEKEAKCPNAGGDERGGTLERVIVANCYLTMTEERVTFLQKYTP